MNELIAVPTVEQINLEHRLAFNKAGEALQHATNCGLMLLQVKASLSHGEWLPWLNGEIESGRLTVGERQARRYMQAASNRTSMSDLKYPAIQEALEIFSDKEPDTEQSALIPVDVEAERQARAKAEAQAEAERQDRLDAEKHSANWHRQYREELELRKQVASQAEAERQRREAAEKVLLEEQQRVREFGTESNQHRIKIRELEMHAEGLERRIDHYESQPTPEPIKVIERVEVIHDDYEDLKAKAAQLETELATNKAEQTRIIQSAIKAKLQGYQGEVDALEAKKRNLEQQAKEYQDYLASLSGTAKQMEAQARSIEKTRQALVDLASELTDFHPVSPDLTRKMLALAEMHDDAAQSLRVIFSPSAREKAA